MSHFKYHWGLVAVFVLLAFGAIRNEMYLGGPWLGKTGRQLARLDRQIFENRRLRSLFEPMSHEAEYLCADLRNRTGTLLASPDDAFTWGAGQVTFLARQSDLQVDNVLEISPGRFPSRREEASRIFEPFQVRSELRGDLDGLRRLIETLQERNPYVVLAGLKIGPVRSEDSLRRITLLLEWPRWSDQELLELVMADPEESAPDEHGL